MHRLWIVMTILLAGGCDKNKEPKGSDCRQIADKVLKLAGKQLAAQAALANKELEALKRETDQLLIRSLADHVLEACTRRELSPGSLECIRNAARAPQLADCHIDDSQRIYDVFGPNLDCKGGVRRGPLDGQDSSQEYYCEMDGKRHGKTIFYDGNSEVIVSRNYKEGALEGAYYEVRDGGHLTGSYKAGKKHGVWELKTVAMERIKFKDGLADGRYELHYDDGQRVDGPLDEEGEFAAGKATGGWRGYWKPNSGRERGDVRYTGDYNGGSRDDTWNFFWKGERRAARGSYKAGKRVGTWEFWDDAGSPIKEDVAIENEWLAREIAAGPSIKRLLPRE